MQILKIIPLLVFVFLVTTSQVYSQEDPRISTIDFVQVLDGNKEEALYYYQNNWKIMRDWAVDRGYIHSYQFMETTPSEEQPYTFVLITTYKNKEQFEVREQNFEILIEEKGPRRLLNEKQPGEFRKIPFSIGEAKNWY